MVQARVLDFQGSPAPEVVREKVLQRQRFSVETLLRAKKSKADHRSRTQAERDAVILHLLRGRTMRASNLYMAYVAACAEKGWPIVTDRMFRNYLNALEANRKIIQDVESHGRIGHFKTVSPFRPPAPPQPDRISKDAKGVSVQRT